MNTKFDYLLNAFESAAQSHNPYREGYADKRKALFDYVRNLEALAASAERAAQAPVGAVPQEFLDRGRSFVRRLYNEPRDHLAMVEVGAWIEYAMQLLASRPAAPLSDAPPADSKSNSGDTP